MKQIEALRDRFPTSKLRSTWDARIAELKSQAETRLAALRREEDTKRLAMVVPPYSPPAEPPNGSGQLLRTLEGHSDRVRSVAFSPDGQRLASGGGDKTIKLWDASTGQLLRSLEEPKSIWSVALSPDGQRLASGSVDGTIKLWE